MSIRNRLRIFSLRYRKSAGVIFRENECNGDREADGIHRAGDVWHEEQGNDIWVYLAVEHFDNPSSSSDRERVDFIFDRCLLTAEGWLQKQYPGMAVQ